MVIAMNQTPEHVKRGHRAPNDSAWAKSGVPSPTKAQEMQNKKES